MSIKDNGRGFNLLGLDKSPPGYHGLSIIKERAEGLGGSVNIITAPGQGTEIQVSLPVEKVRL
jgi:NarL family two-component system sensor histidine kinase LiaS